MFEKVIRNIIKYLFLIIFTLVLFIDLFFSMWNYNCKKEFLIPNFIIVLLAIVIIGLGYFLKYKTKVRNIKIRSNNLILILTLILFVLEVYVANNVYFKTGWDVGFINSAAQAIAMKNNEIVINSSSYFSHYPNNIIITLLFSLITKIHTMIGFIQPIDGYFGTIIFQCVLFALAGLYIYRIIENYTKSCKYALLGWIFYVVLLGLSTWYVIPYSDGTGLIFPILILYFYQRNSNQKLLPLKWGLITLLAYWGYRIKPQIIIIFIAIIIVEITKFVGCSKKLMSLKKNSIVIGTCIIIGLMSIKINDILVDKSGFKINKNDNIGILHFVKMGLNNESDGVYHPRDVDYSMSILNSKERNKKNLDIIKKRLNNYGIVGLSIHIVKKTLVNFNDGTFAWGQEGHFYNEIKVDVNTSVAPRLKKIYYNYGKYYKYLSTLEQMFWIVSLILLLGICFSKSNDNVLFVILLSLIGITIFELIFEARARYFIVYVPLFITCAMIGLREIMNFRIKKEG